MSISKVSQLYEFPDNTFIENVFVRPNGKVLLTSLSTNKVFQVDPSDEDHIPKVAVELPDCTSLTGIARIGEDSYAISGGTKSNPFLFDKGSLFVYTASFEHGEGLPHVKKVAAAPDAEVLNGMTSLPDSRHVILSADSVLGRIFRVDTSTGKVDVTFQDDELAKLDQPSRVPCGVNGIKILGQHLYVTNSAKRTFGRIPITSSGDRCGDTELFTVLPKEVSAFNADDDFDFDSEGWAWVARHPSELVKISLVSKEQKVMINADSHNVRLANPTATAYDRERNVLYVVTGGSKFTGGSTGGQLVQVALN